MSTNPEPEINTDKFTSGFNPSCILHRPKMSSGSEKVITEIPVNEEGILSMQESNITTGLFRLIGPGPKCRIKIGN
jgi:hypothetical protein